MYPSGAPKAGWWCVIHQADSWPMYGKDNHNELSCLSLIYYPLKSSEMSTSKNLL